MVEVLLLAAMAAATADLLLQPPEVLDVVRAPGPRFRWGRPSPDAVWSLRVDLTLEPDGEAPVTTVLTLLARPVDGGWSVTVSDPLEQGARGGTQAMLAAVVERLASEPGFVSGDVAAGYAVTWPDPGEDGTAQAVVASVWEVLRALPVALPRGGAGTDTSWTVRRAVLEPGGHRLGQEAALRVVGVDRTRTQVTLRSSVDTLDASWAGDDLDVRLHSEVEGDVWIDRGAPWPAGARLTGRTELVVVRGDDTERQGHTLRLSLATRQVEDGDAARLLRNTADR